MAFQLLLEQPDVSFTVDTVTALKSRLGVS